MPLPTTTNVTQHPTSWALFQEAHRRFMERREAHRVACQSMWAGTLATSFTQQEIDMLNQAGMLSPNDLELWGRSKEAR